jgi:putative nucleotidyltransferase-like protein
MASAVSPTLAPEKKLSSPVVSVSWSKEFELVRSCCAEKADLYEALAASLRWERVVPLAEHHGLVPKIHDYLLRSAIVPDFVQAALRKAYDDNLRRTLWLTRELLRVLDHLKEHGIAAMSYKGPVLAEMLYGNVTARQFSDLDLLIRHKDVLRAKAALGELGYESSLHLSSRQTRAYLQSGYEYSFGGRHGSNLLELQWQILPRFYAMDFDMERMFERGVQVRVGGVMVQTVSKEDLILTLCVHAAKHAWGRLSWLCDIRELARSAEIDWKYIDAESRRIGIQRIVALAFFLIERLFREESPENLGTNRDAQFEVLGEQILEMITGETELDPESLSYFSLMLRIREKNNDRLRLGWRLLTTPGVREWEAVRLPDSLLPLYRAVRLVRVAGRVLS